MFVVTEANAAAIRTIFQQRGELSAAIELRRCFLGITDNALARECVRTIAGWQLERDRPRRGIAFKAIWFRMNHQSLFTLPP